MPLLGQMQPLPVTFFVVLTNLAVSRYAYEKTYFSTIQNILQKLRK